jgi:hypothetical protein
MPGVQIPHRPGFWFKGEEVVFVGAYALIVVLTWALVIMNVRAVVQQYVKDRNAVRLYSYLATLLVMCSLIIGVTSAIIQRVIDSENFLLSDNASSIRYYHH